MIKVPLPDERLAVSAMRALQVDAELSPLVRRSITATKPSGASITGSEVLHGNGQYERAEERGLILSAQYKATTNRMLRVAVNGFMESLGVVLEVMEQLDVDVLEGEDS